MLFLLLFSAKIQTPSYAFSAYDLSASRPLSGSTLVFTHTLVNENEVYSTTTGKFNAPCDGIYEFHSILSPHRAKTEIYVEFKAGEIAIGRFSAHDTTYLISSSGSAIARLRTGTEVYLRVTARSSGFRFEEDTYRMNTFSGHFISN